MQISIVLKDCPNVVLTVKQKLWLSHAQLKATYLRIRQLCTILNILIFTRKLSSLFVVLSWSPNEMMSWNRHMTRTVGQEPIREFVTWSTSNQKECYIISSLEFQVVRCTFRWFLLDTLVCSEVNSLFVGGHRCYCWGFQTLKYTTNLLNMNPFNPYSSFSSFWNNE